MKMLNFARLAAAFMLFASTLAQAATPVILGGMDMKGMTEKALAAPMNPVSTTISSGFKYLGSADENLCVITGIGGSFAGGGEHVGLTIDAGAPGGAKWKLSAQTGQGWIKVTATCVRKDRFSAAAVLGAKNVLTRDVQPRLHQSCDFTAWPPALSGSANAFFVREMAGKFAGGGEYLAASQKGMGGLQMGACSGYVYGALQAIGFGGTSRVKYVGPSGVTTDPAAATFRSAWEGALDPRLAEAIGGLSAAGTGVILPPVEESLCGLVAVRGPFKGAGEYFGINQQTGADGKKHWGAGWTNSTGSLAFRCIARDQR